MTKGPDQPDQGVYNRLDSPNQDSQEETTEGDFDGLFNSLVEAQRALMSKLARGIELYRSLKKSEVEEAPLYTLLREIENGDLEPFSINCGLQQKPRTRKPQKTR